MRRLLVPALVALVTSFVAGNAKADWRSFWDRVHLDFHRNVCWPEPFVHADRQVTREPLAMMVHNGWKLQNTIGDDLFNSETQELTNAGKLRVRWVLTQTPEHRRQVYVLRGHTARITSVRLESVEATAAQIVTRGGPSEVLLSDTPPRGGWGDDLQRIGESYRTSLPLPRLPEMSDGSD